MDEYMSVERVWKLTCPGCPEEIGRARRWARDVFSGSPWQEDVALIVTELATNAVLYTASGTDTGTIHLTLAVSACSTTVSVSDDGPSATAPRTSHPAEKEAHGRGFQMILALADHVETRFGQHGGTVTARITHKPSAGQELAC